jgi:hypothetical protein
MMAVWKVEMMVVTWAFLKVEKMVDLTVESLVEKMAF